MFCPSRPNFLADTPGSGAWHPLHGGLGGVEMRRATENQFVFVFDWFEELKQRVPTDGSR